jgi:opacity protein-like surface antigen
MRRLLFLFLATLIPVLTATAQENVVSFAPPAAAATPQIGGSDYAKWQIAIAYQYNSYRLFGKQANSNLTSRFHTNGYNISVARYFNDWFGAEAQIGFGFGNTGTTTFPNKLVAKSVFVGGGPRIAFRNSSRLEPWGHGVVGLHHFRFTQSGGPFFLGSNSAVGWLAGGGLDIRVSERVALRGQADYLGTHYFDTHQRNYQIIAGLVFNF